MAAVGALAGAGDAGMACECVDGGIVAAGSAAAMVGRGASGCGFSCSIRVTENSAAAAIPPNSA